MSRRGILGWALTALMPCRATQQRTPVLQGRWPTKHSNRKLHHPASRVYRQSTTPHLGHKHVQCSSRVRSKSRRDTGYRGRALTRRDRLDSSSSSGCITRSPSGDVSQNQTRGHSSSPPFQMDGYKAEPLDVSCSQGHAQKERGRSRRRSGAGLKPAPTTQRGSVAIEMDGPPQRPEDSTARRGRRMPPSRVAAPGRFMNERYNGGGDMDLERQERRTRDSRRHSRSRSQHGKRHKQSRPQDAHRTMRSGASPK